MLNKYYNVYIGKKIQFQQSGMNNKYIPVKQRVVPPPPPPPPSVRAVQMARGTDTTHYYSTDAITWSAGTVPSARWRAVDHNKTSGRFIAVSEDGNRMMRSTDGINWTVTVTSSTNAYFRDIFYDASRGYWYAVGYSIRTDGFIQSLAWRSGNDGTNWSAISLPSGAVIGQSLNSVAANSTRIVMMGTAPNTVYISTNGINFTTTGKPTGVTWSLATNGTRWFATGSSGSSSGYGISSSDGITWTLRTTSIGNQFARVSMFSAAIVITNVTSNTLGDNRYFVAYNDQLLGTDPPFTFRQFTAPGVIDEIVLYDYQTTSIRFLVSGRNIYTTNIAFTDPSPTLTFTQRTGVITPETRAIS
jgi:hypothetical protein